MENTRHAYDVAVKEDGQNWTKAGPLFKRCAVALTGRVDRRWLECYRQITADSPRFSRFHLDEATTTVTFTCRATDGPAEVMGVIKCLEALLERVNQEANARIAA